MFIFWQQKCDNLTERLYAYIHCSYYWVKIEFLGTSDSWIL